MPLLVGIPFLVVIAAFFALGAATQARAHGNAFTNWLLHASAIGVFLIGPVARLGVSLARYITHEIGQAAAPLLHMGATWLSGLAQWASVVVESALHWPYELSRFAYWLLDVELPRLIRAIPHYAATITHTITKRLRPIETTIVKLPKLSKAAARALVAAAVATYVHPFLSDLRWLQRHFHALTAVLPRALPIPTVPAIPNIRKRLAKLEKALAAGVGVALLARALARMRIGWVRCSKVGRLGRAVCGMNDSLLDGLLLDALAIFSVFSVVEFATELRAVEDEALAIMGRLVREWPA